MSYLDKIKGQQIIDIQELSETYYPIQSSKDDKSEPQTVPSIWMDLGEYKITITNPVTLENCAGDIYSFINQTISKVIDTDEQACLITTSGQKLIIDLRSEAYIGPEAMVLYGPNDLIVVY